MVNRHSEKIIIFDTTLSDGEHSPGCSMNPEEKLRVARQLEKLGVDVIEAGFPISSEKDFLSVHQIAREIRSCQIACLARTEIHDIDCAWDAVKDAEAPRIHTFLSSSDIHLKYLLKKTREQVLKEAVVAVAHARKYTSNVEFSSMDATRTDRDYLCAIVEAVISAGATTINIPDTVGYSLPDEFNALIEYLFCNVKNIGNVVVSVHCHNDLGVAVANSLSVLKQGVRQIECTLNGIGKRAGNTALEEVVMAIETRKDLLNYSTGINTRQLCQTSRLLTEITGIPVQPNKAIVGANAFSDESGISREIGIKNRLPYEIISPEVVGYTDISLAMGKHSGRLTIQEHLDRMGFHLDPAEIDKVFFHFKELAHMKKEIFDEDLEAIIHEKIFQTEDKYSLVHLNVTCGNAAVSKATMQMNIEGRTVQEDGFGVGPVDATFAAIRKITNTDCYMERYALNDMTGGAEEQGEVTVRLKYNGHSILGRGLHQDVIVASAIAYINALNRFEWHKSCTRMIME